MVPRNRAPIEDAAPQNPLPSHPLNSEANEKPRRTAKRKPERKEQADTRTRKGQKKNANEHHRRLPPAREEEYIDADKKKKQPTTRVRGTIPGSK